MQSQKIACQKILLGERQCRKRVKTNPSIQTVGSSRRVPNDIVNNTQTQNFSVHFDSSNFSNSRFGRPRSNLYPPARPCSPTDPSIPLQEQLVNPRLESTRSRKPPFSPARCPQRKRIPPERNQRRTEFRSNGLGWNTARQVGVGIER